MSTIRYGQYENILVKNALAVSGAAAVTGAATFASTVAITGALTQTGALSIDDTTEASSTVTGSIHTDGGLGVAKKLYVGSDINVATAAMDLIVKANTAAALEVYDATTKALVIDTRNTVTGITNFLFTAMPSTIAGASGVTKRTVGITPGTTTLTGSTGVNDMSGLALYIAQPTLTDTSAITVAKASTVCIAAAPTTGGSVTVTAGYALEIAAGNLLTAGKIIVDDTTEASSTTVASVQTDGGLAVAKKLYVGGDINVATAAIDLIVGANTASALEVYDSTTKIMAFDTRNTVTGVTALAVTVPAATIATASGVTRVGMSITPGTTTLTGVTGVTAMHGLGLYVAQPTVTDESAATVAAASTVYIANAPTGAGSGPASITNAYALYVAGGGTYLAGAVSLASTLATTGATTVSPGAAGTFLDFALETEWVSGSLIRADFGSSTTLSDDAILVELNANSNVTMTTDKDVRIIQAKLPALTQSAANTTSLMGFDLPTAGALVQDTAAGTINWRGVNIQLPNTTQTTGTVSANGITVLGGTHTSGTVYGIEIDGAMSRGAHISVDQAAPNLGDGYGGAIEAELNTSGIQAGHIAASSAWVNVNGTVAAGGNIVAARNDGIYVNTGGSGDLTNAIAIFGARMHMMSAGNEIAACPFSLNVSGTTTDALFYLYNSDGSTEMGYVADGTTDDGKIGAVPLYIDGNTSTKYWVRIYNGAS